ncbi:hypothetical protein C8F01DRAFT_1076904 [Mycena amicta]|nr:hypothetical protein C8F01DRAFT_1076904 [Mycena amicta]
MANAEIAEDPQDMSQGINICSSSSRRARPSPRERERERDRACQSEGDGEAKIRRTKNRRLRWPEDTTDARRNGKVLKNEFWNDLNEEGVEGGAKKDGGTKLRRLTRMLVLPELTTIQC